MGEITKIDDAYLWNITKIAQAFGVSRDTVRKRLTAAGVAPVKKTKGIPVYSLDEVGPAVFATAANVAVTKYEPDELPPKDRKDFYQSENERLKFEKSTGQLIPVEEVRTDQVRVLKTVVAFFDGLPDKMERKRLFSGDQLNALESVSDETRDQLYRELMDISDD